MCSSRLQEWVCVGVLLLLVFVALSGVLPETTDPPAHYFDAVQELYSRNKWEDGKRLLDRGLRSYPKESNLQMLAGKYYLHYNEYDRARYHLVKSVDDNYNNVDAKQMLVNVEEETGNYSSAICYVNELLEVMPYWRGLWRRKIQLYAKQGNKVEADRLFKRLQQIYPNDEGIRRDYFNTLEENFLQQRRAGDRRSMQRTLEEMVRINPQAKDYQLLLINHYLKEGNAVRAIEQAGQALTQLPNDRDLFEKQVGMLAESGRHTEAMALVKETMRQRGSSAALQRMYGDLLMESARRERQQDPYVLYGMVYERERGNREALSYLLSTSIVRGYEQDALYYLNEAKRVYGNDKITRLKEYELACRMGKDKKAYGLLAALDTDFPDDYDISLAMCEHKMATSENLMDHSRYAEALPDLRYVVEKNIDPELTQTALQRLYDCCLATGDTKGAGDALDALQADMPVHSLVMRRAALLDKQGQTEEALALYASTLGALGDTVSAAGRNALLAGYEEAAIPYIKRCMQEGAYPKAYKAASAFLSFCPDHYLALRYIINAAGALGYDDSFAYYTEQGMAAYPDDPAFVVKKSAVLDRQGEHAQSLTLLRNNLAEYPGDADLVNAFSASSELEALNLSRNMHHDAALAVVDSALALDASNRSLKYTKGLIYEKARRYDSASYYQQFYEPMASEKTAYMNHLCELKNKSFRNEIDIEYMQSRYSEKDVISGVATVAYTRRAVRNNYTGRLNYAGRNGDFFNADGETTLAAGTHRGGTGLQLCGDWEHLFDKGWNSTVSLGVGRLYFPKILASASLGKYLKNDWEVDGGLGYRLLSDKKNLFNLNGGVAKTISDFRLSGRVVLSTLSSKLFVNTAVGARYYPMGGTRTSIEAMAGIGTAPELAIIDYYSLSGSFSHLNTMVGLGGQCLLTGNLSLGLLGTWHTLYDQKKTVEGNIATQYRNLYNIHVQVSLSF